MVKLDVQSLYHIELDKNWPDKIYDVQIVGMSSISNVNELDRTVNIKKEFFTDYKLGISKYLLLITDSTIIYVAKPIKTYDPKVIDEDTQLFIPESLINFSRSFKYVEAKRYNFDTFTGIKRFDNLLNENDFLEEATTKITKAINDVDEFMSDTVSINVGTTEVVTTENVLATLDKERKELIDAKKQAILQDKLNREAMERNMYSKTVEADSTIKDYEELKTTLENQIGGINELQEQNRIENETLLQVKDIMSEMMDWVRSGEVSPETLPTFDELYQWVKDGKPMPPPWG